MISRIIKVEIGVISRSRRLRLISAPRDHHCYNTPCRLRCSINPEQEVSEAFLGLFRSLAVYNFTDLGTRFSKLPVITGPVKMFCFCIPDGGFQSFEILNNYW